MAHLSQALWRILFNQSFQSVRPSSCPRSPHRHVQSVPLGPSNQSHLVMSNQSRSHPVQAPWLHLAEFQAHPPVYIARRHTQRCIIYMLRIRCGTLKPRHERECAQRVAQDRISLSVVSATVRMHDSVPGFSQLPFRCLPDIRMPLRCLGSGLECLLDGYRDPAKTAAVVSGTIQDHPARSPPPSWRPT